MHSDSFSIKTIHTRGAVALAVFATWCWIAAYNWDGSVGEVSVSPLHWRLFIFGYLVAVFLHASIWALAPRWRSMSKRPMWAMVIVTSLLVGLAVGTTDWSGWTISRWWQFWWTCPLLVASICLIGQIHQAQSSNAEPSQGDAGRSNLTAHGQHTSRTSLSHR